MLVEVRRLVESGEAKLKRNLNFDFVEDISSGTLIQHLP